MLIPHEHWNLRQLGAAWAAWREGFSPGREVCSRVICQTGQNLLPQCSEKWEIWRQRGRNRDFQKSWAPRHCPGEPGTVSDKLWSLFSPGSSRESLSPCFQQAVKPFWQKAGQVPHWSSVELKERDRALSSRSWRPFISAKTYLSLNILPRDNGNWQVKSCFAYWYDWSHISQPVILPLLAMDPLNPLDETQKRV